MTPPPVIISYLHAPALGGEDDVIDAAAVDAVASLNPLPVVSNSNGAGFDVVGSSPVHLKIPEVSEY